MLIVRKVFFKYLNQGEWITINSSHSTIDYSLSLKGAVFFLLLMFIVLFLDSVLYFVFELASIDIAKLGLNTQHFKWHLFAFFNNDKGRSVFSFIAANKPGFLNWSYTYIIGFSFFLLVTMACYLSIFMRRIWEEKGRVHWVLKIILTWVIVKQLILVFVIPPWQGPDEIYHYLYIGSFFKEEAILKEKVKKSSHEFDFQRLTDIDPLQLPSFRWEFPTIHSNQPPLYYYVVQKVLSITGITQLPASIYIGRLVSSFCFFLTVGIVYLIAKRVIICPYQENMAIGASLFVAALPQISFISATMSGDAMVNMFASLFIFWILMAMDDGRSMQAILIFLFLAFFTAILALVTKSIGVVLFPALLVGGIIAINGKWYASLKKKMLVMGGVLVGIVLGLGAFYFFNIKGTEFDVISFRFNFDNYNMQYLIGNMMSGLTFKGMIFKSAVFFVSFWVTYGWMVFKASPGTYLVLFIYTLVVLWGLIKFLMVEGFLAYGKSNIFLLFFGLYVILFCYLLGDPQGRYFFIGIPSLAVMLTTGLWGLCPERYKEISLKFVGGSLLLFNLISFFGLMVPVFYIIT